MYGYEWPIMNENPMMNPHKLDSDVFKDGDIIVEWKNRRTAQPEDYLIRVQGKFQYMQDVCREVDETKKYAYMFCTIINKKG